MKVLLELLVLCVAVVRGQQVDFTLTENSSGTDVVEAVIDRIRSNCLFNDDRFLLRRLAYTESRDGKNSDTYRDGYHGGIWQVDNDMFLSTKKCDGKIEQTCKRIEYLFQIDWRQVIWQNLRKPLYSALAAMLFIQNNVVVLPQDIVNQARFWANVYRPGSNMNSFFVASQKIGGLACSAALDLTFILDGSGSIQDSEFNQVRMFVNDVVKGFDISDTGVRVAVVEFSSHVGSHFFLNSYTDKDSLEQAILKIPKSGQTTNTAAAIEFMTSSIFTANNGARSNAKRVLVLLTDGVSGDTEATKAAAQKAKDMGIIVFTVGVGNVNIEELETVSSEPSCTHFYKLNRFSEFDHLVYEIKRRSCTAPKVLSVTPNKDLPATLTTSLGDKPITSTFVVKSPTIDPRTGEPVDKVIKAEVECGILKIYASHDFPNPGPAFFDTSTDVVDGRPSITRINTVKDGKPLYVTVIGTKLQESCSDVLNCKDAKFKINITDAPSSNDVSVICRSWEGDRDCTRQDLINNGYITTQVCPDPQAPRVLDGDNPCTSSALASNDRYLAHPDITKFLVCIDVGRYYVVSCPDNGVFDVVAKTCNGEAIFSFVTPSRIPDATTNFDVLCVQAMKLNRMHFAHPSDSRKFIQCDQFGTAIVKDCGAGTVWNDDFQNCGSVTSKPFVMLDPSVVCNGVPDDTLIADPNDISKYIHCYGRTYFSMQCGFGTLWNNHFKRCT